MSLMLKLFVLFTCTSCAVTTTPPISKSIDFYVNFPGRTTDFLLGNNSMGWANTTQSISKYTRSVYQCCNGFLLGEDGKQRYNPGNDTWGQSAYVLAGKRVFVNIDPVTNLTASPPITAASVCGVTLARKEAYAAELIAIAAAEGLHGFMLDWEDATGNNVTCFNLLWGFVAQAIRPHGLSVSSSMVASHAGPLDRNSTEPWSTEWDYVGFVDWAGTLVNMGTYPGSWSPESYPAYNHVKSLPCSTDRSKTCGLDGQILDMLKNNVTPGNGQLSLGLSPEPCSPNGTITNNGWTQSSLKEFLGFADEKGVRTVTMWFSNALQTYADSFTCAWFIPTIVDWLETQN